MQSSQKSPAQIGVLLFERFSNHCLANAVEPLRAANTLSRRRLYAWRFLSPDGRPVTSSGGMPVLPEMRLADHPGGACLMVLPSYGFRALLTPDLSRGLRAAAGRFDMVAGLDTGSWLMAASNLLDGYRATIHQDEFDAFSETFPQLDADSSRFVIDRDRASCGGAMSAFDLVQEMIGRAHGPALCAEIAALFMQSDAPPRSGMRPGLVDAALALMRRNLEHPLAIPALARTLGCTQRKLETRFQARMGVPPRRAYQRLRLLAARRLAGESRISVAEIALRAGYADASAMTRAYLREFGETPRQTRAARQLGRTVPVTGASNSSSK